MKRPVRHPRQVTPAAILALGAALLVGVALGWVLKPTPPKAPPLLLTEALEALVELETRASAVVEILNDMAEEKVNRDPGALNMLRDSMQEITGSLGDVRSQLRVLQK